MYFYKKVQKNSPAICGNISEGDPELCGNITGRFYMQFGYLYKGNHTIKSP